jgi:hypothetical protein
MAVSDLGPLRVVLALRARDVIDLWFRQFAQHAEPCMVACATGTLLLTVVRPSIFDGSPRMLRTGADAAGGTAVTSRFHEPRDNLNQRGEF